MSLRPGAAAPDIFHETVHAYNDLVSGISNDQMDEGIAHAVDYTFSSLFVDLKLLTREIQNSSGSVCLGDEVEIGEKWQVFWSTYHQPSTWPIAYDNAGTPNAFNLTHTHFQRAIDWFGISISCSDIAGYLNEMLGMNGCCLTLNCTAGQGGPHDIPAGGQIDALFR